jgi:hypothetical protein
MPVASRWRRSYGVAVAMHLDTVEMHPQRTGRSRQRQDSRLPVVVHDRVRDEQVCGSSLVIDTALREAEDLAVLDSDGRRLNDLE